MKNKNPFSLTLGTFISTIAILFVIWLCYLVYHYTMITFVWGDIYQIAGFTFGIAFFVILFISLIKYLYEKS